jgi:membrane protein DedA with SNARE-associated domain
LHIRPGWYARMRKCLRPPDDTGARLQEHQSVLASLANAAQTAGYPALFILVMSESSGVPVPGETALVAAAILASQGSLQIELVIPVAALAAIVGDNMGYLISRRARPLERPGPLEARRRHMLEVGEPFFRRHGPTAVFIARWVVGLRTWASWLAGASRMPWRSFAVWNAAGAVSWATTMGLVAYFVGRTATSAIAAFGLFGVLAVVVAASGRLVVRRTRAR